MIGAVEHEVPAETAQGRRQRLTPCEIGAGVILANGFGAAGDELFTGFRIGELGAAGIGEGLFRRIGNFHHMAA